MMKKIIIFLFFIAFVSCRSNQYKGFYLAKDSSGNLIQFYGSASVGESKYLVNYDGVGWKDLVETNDLPKRDTVIVRRYSKSTGRPIATTEVRKFFVINKK